MVTGEHGFVGKHLCKRLKQEGAIISKNSCDIRNKKKVQKSIEDFRPDIIYHLAAVIDRDIDNIETTFDVNFNGTFNLLESVRKSETVSKIIIMGTSDEYGVNLVPFKENQAENPQTTYAASKVCASYLCRFYSDIIPTSIVILRPFIIYGPGQDNDMLIPSLMRAYFNKKEFIIRSGVQKRDFIYIDDMIEAMIRAALTWKKSMTINICSGNPSKIIDVVNIMKTLTKNKIKIKEERTTTRVSDSFNRYGDPKLAEKYLNWTAETSLKIGLQNTFNSWKKKKK